jgi:hypothetical protein
VAFKVFLVGGPHCQVTRCLLAAIFGLCDEAQRSPTVTYSEEIRGGIWVGRPFKHELH